MPPIRDLIAKAAEKAAERAVAWFGETFSYRRSSTVTQVSGRLAVLSTSTRYAYFTAAESSGWANPAYLLTVAGDLRLPSPFASAEPTSGDFVRINGTDFQVRKVIKQKMVGRVWRTLLFLAN